MLPLFFKFISCVWLSLGVYSIQMYFKEFNFSLCFIVVRRSIICVLTYVTLDALIQYLQYILFLPIYTTIFKHKHDKYFNYFSLLATLYEFFIPIISLITQKTNIIFVYCNELVFRRNKFHWGYDTLHCMYVSL